MNNTMTDPSRQFSFEAPTNKPGIMMAFSFEHTDHSFIRSRQRSINNDKLSVALRFGEPVYKQGLVFYILGEKDIPEHMAKMKKAFRNTVVVVAGNTNKIITCYCSAQPYKHIKKKLSRLAKEAA